MIAKNFVRMLKDVNAKKKAATQYFNRLLKRNKNENIKLIAVAKNESPYLLEWIFHHLYFGFKEMISTIMVVLTILPISSPY
ncbi:hypothetical protein EP12_17215 [Alteromonas australica]|nr:hypothetical protein EP12_17215 [Alteromonas australica]